MAQQRTKGSGSVSYDDIRGRWVGSIETGWTERGTRRRRRVTGRTRAEVQRKIVEIQRAGASETVKASSVKAWAEQWLEITSSTLRPSTWTNNRTSVTRWIVPTIGHRRLDKMTPADVRAVSVAILGAGRAPSTAVRTHAVLGTMLRAAIIEGYTVPQSVLLVEAPAIGETDRDAIPLSDALALLNAAASRPDSSRWVAAFLNGLRPAEARGLTWSSIDFEHGTIDVSWQLKALPYRIARDVDSGFRTPTGYVSRHLVDAWHLTRPKSKSGVRVIPMVPWLSAALLAWRDAAPRSPHDLVWPRADGRPMLDKVDRAAFVALQDSARVAHLEDTAGRRYALYEARHTTATLLKEAGVDDETIISIMGHASILSTKAYLHTSSARTRKALTDLAATLGLAIEP